MAPEAPSQHDALQGAGAQSVTGAYLRQNLSDSALFMF